MRNIVIRHVTAAITLALATFAAHAVHAADIPPVTPAERSPVKPVVNVTLPQSTDKESAGLTREQVREDLKRYQREHANPSYAEMVFLR